LAFETLRMGGKNGKKKMTFGQSTYRPIKWIVFMGANGIMDSSQAFEKWMMIKIEGKFQGIKRWDKSNELGN